MQKTSIIIPLFNREKLIPETIQSLKNQTYKYWEAIVIDDGSTDNSFQIAEDLAKNDKRIKLYKRSRLPKGAPTCRNIGIKKATGKYIIFLDSDDLLKPFSLQQRLETINNNPELDYWIFQTVNFKDKPENEKEVWSKISNDENLNRFLKLDSVWHTSGPVWKAEVLQKIKFDEKLKCWQDVDFHLQALFQKLKYKTFFDLPADVLYRRHSAGSISQGGINKEKRKSQFYFIKKYLDRTERNEQKTILNNLFNLVIKKNWQSRFYRNYFEMLLWRFFNK